MRIIFITILLYFCMEARPQDGRSNDFVENKSEVRAGESIDEKIRKNFFLKADISKTECYVGEPVMAVFKAYSRLDASSQVLKRPSLSGFSVLEMVDAYSNEPHVEQYKGENFNVHLIRKVQLFPIQPGTFTIEPAEVESMIHLRKGDEKISLRDFFRRKKGDAALERQMVFQTPPVEIKVSALPIEGQPAEFSGAVGDFQIQVQLEDSSIGAREPVVVKLIVSGTGNFPLVTEPKVNWSPAAEISGPTVSEQVNKYAFPLAGMKTFQFTIVHRDSGSFIIPPIKFSYFDPSTKKYKTAESKEVRYSVSATSEKSSIPSDQMIFRNENETPVHYYYFAIIVGVIICVIVWLMLRPAKKK